MCVEAGFSQIHHICDWTCNNQNIVKTKNPFYLATVKHYPYTMTK